MEGGRDRARPTGAPESVEELLARHATAPTGGRAARRRAAEARAEAPEPSTVEATTALRPHRPAPADPRPRDLQGPGRRHDQVPGPPPAARARQWPAATPGPPAGRAGPGAPPSPRYAGAARTGPARPGPARDDIGTGAQDISEQAERTRRTERTGVADTRSQRIDETLTRLTAAHTGLKLPVRDGEDEEPPDEEKPARRRLKVVHLLVLALAVAVVATTTVGWAAQGWLGSAVRNVAALDEGSAAIRDADAQQGDQNVLVVATDKSPATVVVAHVPAGGGPMTVLSVPADLEISRPPCERFNPAAADYTDEIVPALGRTRLATALDAGGPRCATRVVQQLTGLAITGYVGVDLARVGVLVDAASGVQVCVTRPVQDRELGPIVPNPGTVTLDRTRATAFVRAADVDGDPPADRGRIERQQQVLAGILDTTLTSTGLLNLPRIAALRPALGAALTTDGADLDAVLALALSLRSLGGDGVSVVPLPTTAGGRGDSVLRDTDAAALFTALRTHAPLPATGSAAGPVPGDMSVQVLNASGRTGVAAKTGDTLAALGFGVGTVSNADQATPQTVIRYSPDQAAAADMLSDTVPAASLVPDPGGTGVLQLVLGRSFDGAIRAPSQPAAAAATAPVTTQSCD